MKVLTENDFLLLRYACASLVFLGVHLANRGFEWFDNAN